MDPSVSQQQSPPIKHMMTIPEKIELTSTGAYPSPQSSGQRADTRGYRAMRVPDKIMLEPTGEEEERREGGEGGGVSGGVGGYFQQPQPLIPDSEAEAQANPVTFRPPVVPVAELESLDRRVQSLEQQMRTLRQAVLQQSGRSSSGRQGYSVWNALTFAGWLMVPLVVVFMFHYRKTSH